MGALIQLRTAPGTRRERSEQTRGFWSSQRSRLPALLAVGLPMAVGLVHVGVVSGRYFVGSFDDDASYIMAAHALAEGHGMTATLPSGMVVASLYPPGYPALLAPLAWLWPHSFAPMRLLSVVCFALLFPLTWWYLERRRVGFAARTAVLCLLALNPVLATYGSMIMAETPFLVGFLVLLLLVDYWDGLSPADASRRARLITGTVVVLVAAAGVWLKEAGIGAVLGLVVWQLWRRRVWRAVAVAAGTVLLLVPVVVARVVAGVPIAGSRYSQELGGYYAGGLVGRVVHVAPHALWQTLTTALPASVVPYHSPLPHGAFWSAFWSVLAVHVSVFAVVGAVSWWRHHRDSAVMVTGIYLAETLLFPFINERRVVLVLPVVIAWYVIGAMTVWRWVRTRLTAPAARARNRLLAALERRPVVLGRGAACLAVVAVVVPLAFQFPRDYLFGLGQSSSHPQGSRYTELLAHLGQPSDVVETDYLSTVALFTGHRTAYTAFTTNLRPSCSLARTVTALRDDHAAYLLLGDLNKPGMIDNTCLLSEASTQPWAVQLLHTSRDQADVYELIGSGTAHPDLQDLSRLAHVTGSGPLVSVPPSPARPSAAASGTAATIAQGGGGWLEWDWSAPRTVTQVSLDTATADSATTGVSLQLDEPGRGWVTVSSSRSAVGDGRGDAAYLLATLPATTQASAARVVVAGAGVVRVSEMQALGPERPGGGAAQSGVAP